MDWPGLIRHLRRQHHEKQASFACRLGIDQATVSRWESGRQIPAPRYREALLCLMNDSAALAGDAPWSEPPPDAMDQQAISAAFAAAPVGLFLLDRNARFTAVNTRMATIMGQPVKFHLGRRPSEVQTDLGRQLEPWLTRILKDGRPLDHIEISGWWQDEPHRWTCALQPVSGPDGTLTAISGAFMASRGEEDERPEAKPRDAWDLVGGDGFEPPTFSV